MELDELDESARQLERSIRDFPVGAKTPDDSRTIEARIADLREGLRNLNGRRLTLNAIIDSSMQDDAPQSDLIRSFDRLNESTSLCLTNSRCLQLNYHSNGLREIVDGGKGGKEMGEKVKTCLDKLLEWNDRLASKAERRKELMAEQYRLKLEAHADIYQYPELLREKEAARSHKLRENDAELARNKAKINQSLLKTYTIKKLITNLIASMKHKLYENEELFEMLAKHKQVVSLETIVELTHNASRSS